MNKDATRKFKTYTKADFAGINVAKVDNLTASTAEIVKAKLDSDTAIKQTDKITIDKLSPSIDIYDDTKDTNKSANNEVTVAEKMTEEDVDTFRSILYIELAEKSKENVLATIKKLEANEDFLYVGPDHYVYMCATPNDANYREQWGLSKIQAPTAWDTRTNALILCFGWSCRYGYSSKPSGSR